MPIDFPILSFIILAPALAALVMLFIPGHLRDWIRAVAVVGSVASMVASFVVAYGVYLQGPGRHYSEFYDLVPSLGIHYALAVDGWGAALLVLTGIIIVSGVFASWTVEDRQKEFFVFLLVLVAGVYGVFVSQDLFIFFLFYEIAVLPMYLLIGIWGSKGKVEPQGPLKWAFEKLDVGGREYAAMKLTLMLLVGSAFILAAMLAMYWEAGGSFLLIRMERATFSPEMQFLAFPALWIGFGTLAGLWPFHTWSPDGHAAAPTAVSMLHAGVLMKLGAFGVIRIGMMLLPEGAMSWAFVVGCVAVLNIVYGAMCAMAQQDLKYIIAYSSVSHMGVVMLGAATLTVTGWNGAVYQMVAHGIMTGLFFALVGLLYERTHDRWVPNMGGFATTMPLTAAFFTLACLSSLGLPGTAGFVAEFLVFLGAWQSPHWWWAIPGAIGAFVTAVYVLRATRMIFWGPGPPEKFAHLKDAVFTERIALWTLGLALIIFGLWPRVMLDLINQTTPSYLAKVTAEQVAEARP